MTPNGVPPVGVNRQNLEDFETEVQGTAAVAGDLFDQLVVDGSLPRVMIRIVAVHGPSKSPPDSLLTDLQCEV